MYKVPKGTSDLVGDAYCQTHRLLHLIETEFQRNGGEPLETPVFERTDVLLGKYGEEADTKLIYHLADEGGEALALRYDLTVPFLRHIKETGRAAMRRYSIGKVYRRDQPNNASGRFREFYQADFDIYGERQTDMLAEATLLHMACQILDSLGLRYVILLNDIRNLQHILTGVLGVTDWRRVCPIVDKLDKQTFDSLLPAFAAAGLTEEQVSGLQHFVAGAGESTPQLAETIDDYRKLLEIAGIFGFHDRIRFTNSLARGLDYYTGFIWEIKLVDGGTSTISAGGRYDGLLGAPSVGISIGVSRLISLMPLVDAHSTVSWKDVYFVTCIGEIPLLTKLHVINHLQNKGLGVQYSMSADNRKIGKVIAACVADRMRYVVILAETEMAAGKIIVKDLMTGEQSLQDIA